MPTTPPGDTVAEADALMSAGRRLLWAMSGWLGGTVASVMAATVALLIIGGASGDFDTSDLTIGWIVLVQVPLWLGLLGAPALAGRAGLDWRRQLGWSMRAVDVPVGVGVGLALQLVLVPLLYVPIFWLFEDLAPSDVESAARDLTDRVNTPFDVSALVLLTVVMAPLAEEVFFRGLVQGALQDGLGPAVAVPVASVIFAASHLQLVQAPALVLVGVAHGLLMWRTGRLGAALWSHLAFNAVTVVVLLS